MSNDGVFNDFHERLIVLFSSMKLLMLNERMICDKDHSHIMMIRSLVITIVQELFLLMSHFVAKLLMKDDVYAIESFLLTNVILFPLMLTIEVTFLFLLYVL